MKNLNYSLDFVPVSSHVSRSSSNFWNSPLFLHVAVQTIQMATLMVSMQCECCCQVVLYVFFYRNHLIVCCKNGYSWWLVSQEWGNWFLIHQKKLPLHISFSTRSSITFFFFAVFQCKTNLMKWSAFHI